MASRRRYREKEVRLTVFNNEPMARLAEQRLRQEGIPCFARSLAAGSHVWGSAYDSPHGLYVYRADEMRAREVLDLPPVELLERSFRGRTAPVALQRSLPRLLATVIIALALVFGITAWLFSRISG